jgi:hypothetical protein
VVARLAARIAKLEKAVPPRQGCPDCAHRLVWVVDDDRLDAPDRPLSCESCGRRPAGTVKVIARSLWEAL